MCHMSLLRFPETNMREREKLRGEKDQHLCRQALSESRTDLLGSCGCG